nr:response regulator transcription factor [Kineosporia rhizophila]
MNGPLLRRVRELTELAKVPVAAVISQLGEADLLTAVDSGLQGVLWREQATAERFSALLRTVASGQGDFPREVQSRLLKDLARLQRNVLRPRGLTPSGLEQREIAVLTLAADGLDTAEIAAKLSCSERTVKNVVSGVLERFNLRNRTHAVAFALRSGLL